MSGTPRPHPKPQIRSLIKSLDAFGQVLPILVDRESRVIHGNPFWKAAKRRSMTGVMMLRVEGGK